jgi:hypothetical protein
MRAAGLMILLLAAAPAGAQIGAPQVISSTADGASAVFAADLDGDGRLDVLSASIYDDKIAWYRNQGGGAFGGPRIISTSANFAQDVFAADLDGDSDLDVLSTAFLSGWVSWYENDGAGHFGPTQFVSAVAYDIRDLHVEDLDGDGDADVLIGAGFDPQYVAWHENLGGGVFGPEQVLVEWYTGSAHTVLTADLDGDGDPDVLSTPGYVAWNENLGGGSFGAAQAIGPNASTLTMHVADLNGDGRLDVLVGSWPFTAAGWHENLGAGSFGPKQDIAAPDETTVGLEAADLDGDGDLDVVTAASYDGPIAWHENLGDASFGPQQVIAAGLDFLSDVAAADLDGDGDPDLLSTSVDDDTVAWFENLHPITDCNGNGVHDGADLDTGTSQDVNLDGVPDECQGEWVDLGQALAGALGEPLFVGGGLLLAGESVTLSLSNAKRNATCYLVTGLTVLSAPFKGGVLVPSPDHVFPFGADAGGSAGFSVAWPAGFPSGFALPLQWWVPDGAGPAGFAASNALSAITP